VRRSEQQSRGGREQKTKTIITTVHSTKSLDLNDLTRLLFAINYQL